jgi:hypothetical protein
VFCIRANSACHFQQQRVVGSPSRSFQTSHSASHVCVCDTRGHLDTHRLLTSISRSSKWIVPTDRLFRSSARATSSLDSSRAAVVVSAAAAASETERQRPLDASAGRSDPTRSLLLLLLLRVSWWMLQWSQRTVRTSIGRRAYMHAIACVRACVRSTAV